MRTFLKHSLPEIISDETVSAKPADLNRIAQTDPFRLDSCVNLFAYTPPAGCSGQSVQIVDRAEIDALPFAVRVRAYSKGADFVPRDPLPQADDAKS
jgi:hypothetical protein